MIFRARMPHGQPIPVVSTRRSTRRACWLLAICLSSRAGLDLGVIEPCLARADQPDSAPQPAVVPDPLLSAQPKPVAAGQPTIAESSGLLLPVLPPVEVPTNTSAELRGSFEPAVPPELRKRLETARHFRFTRQPREAEPILIDLLAESSPEPVKQQALLELAAAAKDQADLPRAEQVYAQYLSRWPNDVLVPEVLLRQGQLFRQMGMNNLALAKFYSVMTSSLVLKNDMLDYYRRLVLVAQTEIAETHFQIGKYAEAADYFSRLLKQTNAALNRPRVQSRLVRSLAALERNEDIVAQAQDLIARYPESVDLPEVRFHFARALKKLNRNPEALQQALTLLQEQNQHTREHPQLWSYWQQRAGNEIANYLYLEGDYTRALEIYLALQRLDNQASWQLPVAYQIGLTYERLAQTERAMNTYAGILQRSAEVGTNASPGLKAVLEMAQWRADFVKWQGQAEGAARAFAQASVSGAAPTPPPQSREPAHP